MGTAGTIIGTLIGLALSLLLTMASFGMATFTHTPWPSVLESSILAIVIGSVLSLLGGIIPAYRAAKMEPVDAMRLEV